MKSFKQILETVYRPKSGDEQAFLDKHVVSVLAHPHATETQFKADAKTPKAKRKADYDEKEDEKVYEAAEVHTKRADKEPVIVRAVDPKTGQSKAKTVMRRAGEIKIGEEVEQIDELSDDKLQSYHAKAGADRQRARAEVEKGMTQKKFTPASVQKTADAYKRFTKRGKGMTAAANKMSEEVDLDEKVDSAYAIGMSAAMKKAGDTPPLKKSTIVKGHEIAKSIMKKEAMDPVGKADADIDNDGDVDKSDKYLHARRKAIGKALRKEEADLDEAVNAKKIAADHEAGHSIDVIVQKHLNKKGDNKDEILKAIQAHRWNKRMKKEEAELDEVSKALLGRYIKKAKTDVAGKAYQLGAKDPLKPQASWSKTLGREKRIDKAVDRLTKEEVELDEISKSTAASYIKKAVSSSAALRAKADLLGKRALDADNTKNSEKYFDASDKAYKKHMNRISGTAKAVDRLTKEEVEQIDEAFKVGAMKLKDGSSVTLTRESVDALNGLFSQLNSANKSKMEERMMSSKKGFQEILSFAENV